MKKVIWIIATIVIIVVAFGVLIGTGIVKDPTGITQSLTTTVEISGQLEPKAVVADNVVEVL